MFHEIQWHYDVELTQLVEATQVVIPLTEPKHEPACRY